MRGVPITVLKTGSYFGEIGLLRDTRRNATVRALSTTLDLFVLTKVISFEAEIARDKHTDLTERNGRASIMLVGGDNTQSVWAL